MPCWPGRKALLCTLVPLLFGWHLPKTHSEQKNNAADQETLQSYLPATMEFALHMFNMESQDKQAYKLEKLLQAWREKNEEFIAFSMELLVRRTKCGKLEEDTENCPFEDHQGQSHAFTCFFTITTMPWKTEFALLNKTCSELPP
ncbi:cystatin-9-like [Ochotona curzoniae]|uniref:cystatin-9-like n=1 Tax=Ochotona curzoniae TaxID=130825 RepID=UPI001B3467E8|nr:cystatin-9-like [Ochotona curzoniae]